MDAGLQKLLNLVRQTEGKEGQDVADIVMEALEDPSIFIFAELIHSAAVVRLREAQTHEKVLNTLDLFSTGTFLQYQSDSGRYVQLTSVMEKKLKLLSILSLCSSQTVYRFFSVILFLFIILR